MTRFEKHIKPVEEREEKMIETFAEIVEFVEATDEDLYECIECWVKLEKTEGKS